MSLTQAYRKGHEGRPGWGFTFTYDEDQIEALKKAVPAKDRSYDPETHEWWVSLDYQDELLKLWPDFEAYLRQLPLF